MTIVGKILVILVFLMSIATGAFFVIDYATRTNWKAAYLTLQREMKVAEINFSISSGSIGNLDREARKFRADSEELKQKLIDQEQKAKALEIIMTGLVEDAKQQVTDKALNLEKAQGEVTRLKIEITDLTDTLKKREDFILKVEKKAQEYRNEAVTNENVAKAMQSRNESLLAQVEALTKANARLLAGPGTDGGGKDPNALNPPSAYVKGTILKIHADDKTLVEISVGSDHGLVKNNTLEVYRLQPQPAYLGTIRIVDARHHNSVGRLMRVGGTTVRQLQEGDIVASTISANK